MTKYPLPTLAPQGMAPAAWNALQAASAMAGVDLTVKANHRLTQTLGHVAASAGTHARDGYVMVGGSRVPYTAAVDLSVTWLTLAEIRAWLDALAWWGFAAWYRPWVTDGKPNHHIHAIYCGVPMKPMLDAQVKDYINGRTGLVGHHAETFYTASPEQDNYIRALWLWSNGGGPNPGTPPKAPAPPPQPDYEAIRSYNLILSGRELPFDAPDIDGTAWVPARPWFEQVLGIVRMPDGQQAVKWSPADASIYVQGRKIAAPVRLLKVGGETQGYLPARALADFSGLALRLNAENRSVYFDKPKSTVPGALPPQGKSTSTLGTGKLTRQDGTGGGGK